MTLSISPGQKNERSCGHCVLDSVWVLRLRGRLRPRPRGLAGDKSHSSRQVRTWLRSKKVRAVIPERKAHLRHPMTRPLSFDAERYRRRNIGERAVGWIKGRWRIATRLETLATHFVAMLQLAST